MTLLIRPDVGHLQEILFERGLSLGPPQQCLTQDATVFFLHRHSVLAGLRFELSHELLFDLSDRLSSLFALSGEHQNNRFAQKVGLGEPSA